jgi:IS30 family transposase
MAYKFTTQEERDKIAMLCEMGVKVAEIARITGRSKATIETIKNGSYEKKKAADRERQRKKYEEKNQEPKTVNVVQQPTQVEAYVKTDPFAPDKLMMRIADDVEYTNSLMNGVLNQLCKLCKALGV